jgi:hypothetical protein
MSNCHCEKVSAARRRVIDELAWFRVDSSEERLTSLKAAIANWHDEVGAWGNANKVKPNEDNLN